MTSLPPSQMGPSSGLMQNIDDMLPMDLDLGNVMDPAAVDAHTGNFHSSSLSHTLSNNPMYAMMANNPPGVGAGPLPTGFGMPSQLQSGSVLTEFTKRRNWTQRVVEELRDFLHILTTDGRFLYASPSTKALTGYDPTQLFMQVMVDFIHPDDAGMFLREFNESIASGNPLRFFYRFKKEDGTFAIFECHGHAHLSSETQNFAPPGTMPFSPCTGFFMMSRPYPTKNASLLDSFLEHKIENERLTKRIAELKREEQEEQEAMDRMWKEQENSNSTTHQPSSSISTTVASDVARMPPPAKPPISNTALTRQNLDEALAASKPDSINDKMARYEGATHLETIEMLTGLRYRDGERAQGISTGDSSPLLIRGDAGIAISVDKDRMGREDKKKKLKVADEYVCTDCGTLDSPEWRKGPNGPKTLCNACGCEYLWVLQSCEK